MIVRTTTVLDIPYLASIHFQSLPDDFLPSLGQDFLEKVYYPAAVKSPNATTFVVDENGSICGFVTVACDSGKFSAEILQAHWISVTQYALGVIIRNPLYLIKCFEVLWSALFSKPDDIKSEIVFIAVDAKNRQRGLGMKLVAATMEYLKLNNITQCRTKTLEKNVSVIAMYEKMGWHVRNRVRFIARDYVIIVSQK